MTRHKSTSYTKRWQGFVQGEGGICLRKTWSDVVGTSVSMMPEVSFPLPCNSGKGFALALRPRRAHVPHYASTSARQSSPAGGRFVFGCGYARRRAMCQRRSCGLCLYRQVAAMPGGGLCANAGQERLAHDGRCGYARRRAMCQRRTWDKHTAPFVAAMPGGGLCANRCPPASREPSKGGDSRLCVTIPP